MLTRRAALVLRLHATFLFFLAMAMIVRPSSILQFMGFAPASFIPELLWTLRLMGIFLLFPALLGPLTAAFAGERGLRQAGAGMGVICCAMGILSFVAPIGITAGKILFAIVSFVFGALYFYALRGRGRNR
jgi:hypothetical protein